MTGDTLLDDLGEVTGPFALHLRSREVTRATAVLHRIADVVRRHAGDGATPPRVSPVAVLPGGPLVRVDDVADDPAGRRRLADAIAEVAARAGFAPVDVVLHDVDGLAELDEAANAVVLRAFPDPAGSAGTLPATWIDLAAEWVLGDLDPEAVVALRVLGVEVHLLAKEATGVLHGCARERAWCDVVTGDVHGRLRTASVSFGVAPHLAIAAGGPRCDDEGLLARFALLAEVARDHVSAAGPRIAYTCLDFEPTFADLGTGLSHVRWADEGGAPPNRVVGKLGDRHVPEAFPHQVLGPRHVARLGGDLPPGLVRVGVDRWELAVGDPRDWLPTAVERDDRRRDGRRALAPLLLAEPDLDRALADAARSRPDPDGALAEDPAITSPVLRVYVRELAASLDGDRLPALRSRTSRAAGAGLVDEATEQRRAWVLADRLLRSHAPRWLDAVGLREAAEPVRALGRIRAEGDVVRGVHLLGRAVTTASRRLELAQRTAGARAELVEALAWDLWEEVGQRSGCTAMADAVVHGVPSRLTFATDQRVMDLSRDVDERAQLEGSTRSLADEVWSAALREVAAAGWRAGWEAAEEAVRHETAFSIRTTLRRSLQDRLDDPDGVALGLLLDDVDLAARDAMARVLLLRDAGRDHWDRAFAASRQVDGGDTWRAAVDETRSLLGPSTWDEAVQRARDQVNRWVGRAPDLAARAVVASVTREVCSVAGRGLITRLAADALARGGSEADAEAAARERLEPMVQALADDALAVLDELP